ncbi:MAG: peptidoglycan D,D-transpeptidase FtsI family protein [Eggerthellaceae bacterium]|jgi:cell division protein FtsI (penicillin-binding protein 3)
MSGSPRKSRHASNEGPSRRSRRPDTTDGAAIVNSARPSVLFIVFLIIAAIFFIRLFYLQVVVADEYSTQAENSRTASIVVEPRRGTIYDRDGTVLAISVDATTIYANPSEVEDVDATAASIAEVLGGKTEDYKSILQSDNTTFQYIQRKADVDKADKLKEKNLKGIYFLSDTRREYPQGKTAGQIIGACDLEVDQDAGREYYVGVSGLELQYNDVLSGTPGRYEAERGQDGTPIPGGVHEDVPATDGQDIQISIDLDLQSYVEDRLAEGISDLGAPSGSSVVMDASTGEIYAIASLPYFNPDDRSVVEEGSMTLKPVSQTFEPGSIFKTVSAMALLETDTMQPDDTIYCPASITADGYTISDAHERGDKTMSLAQIIQESSNVGISLSTEKMGFDKLYDYLQTYNMHEATGIDYPGEAVGYLQDYKDWSRVTGYNVSFGQGISVTPLTMTRFYGALVNDGVEVTPHFLIKKLQTGEEPQYATEDVIANKDAIPKMESMLRGVVTGGTGVDANIDGYDVVGKTSTAQIYDEQNGGYRDGVYNLCFTGYIANSNSKLVCFVGANEVNYTGVVTPIFKDIMTTAIDYYKITPNS